MCRFPAFRLLILAVILSFPQIVSAQTAGAVQRPNIVFILADDLGYGDVSCNETGSKIATPNIDRIAREGMRFTNAHSPSSVCTPTRYGLLTGRYAWRTQLKKGVLMSSFAQPLIEESRLTVPELLREHGYATAMIGKWHLGLNGSGEKGTLQGGPVDHGFDSYFGVAGSANFPPYTFIRDRGYVADPTLDVTGEHWNYEPAQHIFKGPAAPEFDIYQLQPRLTEEAVDTIRAQAKGEQPFFLYYAMTAPHYPVVPAPEFQGTSGINRYADFVRQVDHEVGLVLNALEEAGVAEDTLIVFTADNGCARQAQFGELMAHDHNSSGGLRGAKQHIYEGGHRVPFVARWPRRIEAGQVTVDLVCLTDLLRTCAEMLQTDLPDDAGEDSYSVLPHLLGAEPQGPVRRDLVSHSAGGNFAIQDERWKLIFAKDGGYRLLTAYPNADAYPTHEYETFQLYHLQDDLREFHNVYADHPEVVQRLTARMTEILDTGRSTPGAPQQNHNGENRWKQVNWIE